MGGGGAGGGGGGGGGGEEGAVKCYLINARKYACISYMYDIC